MNKYIDNVCIYPIIISGYILRNNIGGYIFKHWYIFPNFLSKLVPIYISWKFHGNSILFREGHLFQFKKDIKMEGILNLLRTELFVQLLSFFQEFLLNVERQ